MIFQMATCVGIILFSEYVFEVGLKYSLVYYLKVKVKVIKILQNKKKSLGLFHSK